MQQTVAEQRKNRKRGPCSMMPTWPTHKIVCMLKSSALLQHPSSSPDTMRIAAHTWNNATVKAPVVTTSGAL